MGIITASSIKAESIPAVKGAGDGLLNELAWRTMSAGLDERSSSSERSHWEWEPHDLPEACRATRTALEYMASCGRGGAWITFLPLSSYRCSQQDSLRARVSAGEVELAFSLLARETTISQMEVRLYESIYGCVRKMLREAGLKVSDTAILSAGSELPSYRAEWLDQKLVDEFCGDRATASRALASGVPIEDVFA